MTAHDHRTVVEGCFRCELSEDEVANARGGTVSGLRDRLIEVVARTDHKRRWPQDPAWEEMSEGYRYAVRATVAPLVDALGVEEVSALGPSKAFRIRALEE